MSEMTAEKARKIIAISMRRRVDDGFENPYTDEYYMAEGYLACLEGPEVRALIEARGPLGETVAPSGGNVMDNMKPIGQCERCGGNLTSDHFKSCPQIMNNEGNVKEDIATGKQSLSLALVESGLCYCFDESTCHYHAELDKLKAALHSAEEKTKEWHQCADDLGNENAIIAKAREQIRTELSLAKGQIEDLKDKNSKMFQLNAELIFEKDEDKTKLSLAKDALEKVKAAPRSEIHGRMDAIINHETLMAVDEALEKLKK